MFLLAQAGVPLTGGFIAKFGVISAAVDVESYAIALIAMLASVIAAYLYLRIMVTMWVGDDTTAVDDDAAKLPVPFTLGLAITAAAAFTLFVGVFPDWLIDAADTVTAYAR